MQPDGTVRVDPIHEALMNDRILDHVCEPRTRYRDVSGLRGHGHQGFPGFLRCGVNIRGEWTHRLSGGSVHNLIDACRHGRLNDMAGTEDVGFYGASYLNFSEAGIVLRGQMKDDVGSKVGYHIFSSSLENVYRTSNIRRHPLSGTTD